MTMMLSTKETEEKGKKFKGILCFKYYSRKWKKKEDAANM